MIRHVVMFRWNAGVSDEHIAATSAALAALPGKIPQIAEYRHGADLGLAEGNFDYVVVGDFASVDAYAVYRDHPDHRAVITAYIADHVATRSAVQYPLDD